MSEPRDSHEITPQQYHAVVDLLWDALEDPALHPEHDDVFHKVVAALASQRAALQEARGLLERLTVDGYEEMPTEKVEKIAESGKSWDKPSARLELERRAFLARTEESEA